MPDLLMITISPNEPMQVSTCNNTRHSTLCGDQSLDLSQDARGGGTVGISESFMDHDISRNPREEGRAGLHLVGLQVSEE